MSVANNVVNIRPNGSVYDDIMAFLLSRELRSEGTRKTYEIDIRQFFKVTRNKDIEHLTLDDLNFRHREIVEYQNYLASHYSNSSVNKKIAAIRSLFNYLARDYTNIRPNVFDIDRLPEDKNSYGVLSYEEAMRLIEEVKKQRKGVEKSLLAEMAIKTSIRASALLSIKWSDIRPHKHYYIVSVIDKGNKRDEKPISAEFYERLQVLRGKYDDDYVFHLDAKTLGSMVKQACEAMGISEERNITFHSLKKVAINFVLETTGDVKLAAQQGNHANCSTTLNNYVAKRNFEVMPGLTMDSKIDLSVLEKLSKEELLRVIEKLSIGAKVEILNKVKEVKK